MLYSYFYGHGISFLSMRKEKLFTMLMFRTHKEEVTSGWRGLRNTELHDL
jgi:hypothetical protein